MNKSIEIKNQKQNGFLKEFICDLLKYKAIYVMLIPIVVYFIIFNYAPIYGVIIAFKDFSPAKGIIGSPWIGLENFFRFFQSYYFWRLLRNTFLISFYTLLFGFPAPIILALLLNEIRFSVYKRTVQTITYMPNFISMVIVCGLIVEFTRTDGLFSTVVEFFGGEKSNLLARPELFRTIFVGSGIWQSIGFGSIIYLATLSNIDQELYSAATIDGAGKLRQTWHITLPGIAPTIIILLILNMGNILNVGFEKIILLYNGLTMETADVISSFVYRKGLLDFDYSFSAAVGLFNSVVNLCFIVVANLISRRFGETSLW